MSKVIVTEGGGVAILSDSSTIQVQNKNGEIQKQIEYKTDSDKPDIKMLKAKGLKELAIPVILK